MEYLYNGGGVAVGDYNNDGLSDIYFTASTVSNRLYLNKGNLTFSDVTQEASVDGMGRWCNAASVVDINNDGWQDIYVCATVKKKGVDRANLLYINKGLNENGVPVFKEEAKKYGLADTSLSVHAAFFDYDNDSDLDMYLLTTKRATRGATEFSRNTLPSDRSDIDKLFRNDYDPIKKHPYYTEVSQTAGINHAGYGLGLNICDIDKDGWKDVYVTNDFFSDDHLYINNKNGTFSEKSRSYFKHSSLNAMGNDVIDINNDGLSDVIAVDMNPEDNFRKKKNMNPGNYYSYQVMTAGLNSFQYVRNTLQLNMGPRIGGNDSICDPIFSDIGFYAGVAETDWSWTPSVADFDNDGFRDLIVTNGYPKDVTDHDFSAFREKAGPSVPKSELLKEIPQIKVANYGFKNNGNLTFSNVTKKWGLDEPSFSAGAMHADLDNDGDLDYIVSNINGKAFLYENTSNKVKNNYVQFKLKGEKGNINGVGAWVEIYYNNKTQVYENSPYRGYLSTCENKIHFGLGETKGIDSAVIRWPGERKQIIRNLQVNQLHIIDIRSATSPDSWLIASVNDRSLFTDITKSIGIEYRHQEEDFIDYDYEKLLPHKFSQYGPGLAAGDVDLNGLDDIFIGGNIQFPSQFLLQQANGTFKKAFLPIIKKRSFRPPENMGVLLFDVDSDKDLDLYCANGSNEFAKGMGNLQDNLYINDGRGNFQLDTLALPVNTTSKSCVKAADFDRDGDLDLFVGGRVLPGEYPKPVNSYIFRNDTKGREVKFTDVTNTVAPKLNNIGLTCDAIWSDFNDDGWVDLVLAGEYQPVLFLQNKNGKFTDVGAKTGINKELGWWNSITAGDFDNDGDTDYIVGNHGANSYYRGSTKYPITMYANDYDKNGRYDPIIAMYMKDAEGKMKKYPAHNRDEIVEQIPGLKKRFLTYQDFGSATFDDIFTKDELKTAQVLKITNLQSSYVENRGSGTFRITALPGLAQVAPLNGMLADDVDDDGNLDLVCIGNDFGAEITNGRQNAMNGLVMLGDGKGKFHPQSILASGFYVPGDAKALIRLRAHKGGVLLAASQNRDVLKVFRQRSESRSYVLTPEDRTLMIRLKDGKVRKEELYYGSSFLSQSARFVKFGLNVQSIDVVDDNGKRRALGAL
jgi:hypothetical protein